MDWAESARGQPADLAGSSGARAGIPVFHDIHHDIHYVQYDIIDDIIEKLPMSFNPFI